MRRKKNKIPKLHVKVGDLVKVLWGDADIKGKTGRILKIDFSKRTAIVEGLNLVTKHIKPTQQNPQGGKITIEAPLPVCKLQLIEPQSGLPTRIGRIKTEKGWKRIAKRKEIAGKIID
ncbi:MAG: 50S ribosomal protein L24 [Bacteroidia bacterium]|nr:50S ribosomal protein L24 [Bacteroidia bacterium]MDW8159380.1 50S ribosomal protein L24 [Bacteroidia bacterium]